MNIFLVEDHPLYCRGLTELIDRESDLNVCGIAATVSAALVALQKKAVDLVLVDLSLKDGSGLELIETLSVTGKPRSLVVSGRDEKIYAERALNAGALGYVKKNEEPSTLLEAIRSVLAGRVFLSRAMSQQLLKRNVGHARQESKVGFHDRGDNMGRSPTEEDTSPVDRLTNRELQVFEQMGKGWTTNEIAKALGLSAKTVETYRERLKRKLDINSLNELIRKAVLWTDWQERQRD